LPAWPWPLAKNIVHGRGVRYKKGFGLF